MLFRSEQIKEATDFVKTQWMDVPYATLSPSETLNIYIPNEGKGPFPTIIYVHGGGFEFGDANEVINENLIKPTLEHGYALVAINYRLSGEAKFPAQIEDVKASIRFMRANAKTYNIDPDRIGLWGSSAGGNLVALAGTTDNSDLFNNPKLGNADVSSHVNAVVDWYGPINFLTMDEQFKESGINGQNHDGADSPESKYLGTQITKVPELVKEANPETYITPDAPAFLIEVGREDNIVPYQQSVNFANELTKVIGKRRVKLVIIPDASHGGSQFTSPANLKIVYKFLNRFLKH